MKGFHCYLLLIVFILGGCSRLPEKLSYSDQIPIWLEHQIAINQIQSWDINGRVAIKTARDSGTATIHWHQQSASYEMRVIAPLGQGTYLFRVSPDGVVMQGPDGKTLVAESPEKLMQTGLGWSVDLDGLQYWIRGIPQPETGYQQLSLDGNGRLSYLDQGGFTIEVQRYAELEEVSLPEKLLIKSNDLQLKMIIKNWKL